METKNERNGCWLPVDPDTAKAHMCKLREESKKKKALSPVMREFKDLIDNDAVVRMNFTKMIDQVPGFYKGSEAGVYLKSIDEMLGMIDCVLDKAPKYNDTDLIGFPINAILIWTMGVPAGAAAFRNEKVNAMFRKIFKVWTEFLTSKRSLYVFTTEEDGWRSENALEKLNMDQYLEDPDADPWPYQSWNDFFIRKFKESDPPQRPIYEPGNEKTIVAACDSKVYNIQSKVKLQDWFWVKSQPYSLWDMLANEDEDKQSNNEDENKEVQCNKEDENKGIQSNKEHFEQYVRPFEGGTVFQAFLSAFKYHRWHSPISGTIKKAYVKHGTYYSAAQSEGMDQAGPDLSQGYIAHTATRALIYIEADEAYDSGIGLMCFIAIGMAEVSSCIIENKKGQAIKPGDRIEKGDQLGYFQYGGSSHCLVFRRGVIEKFTDEKGEEIKKDTEIEVGQCIALAR